MTPVDKAAAAIQRVLARPDNWGSTRYDDLAKAALESVEFDALVETLRHVMEEVDSRLGFILDSYQGQHGPIQQDAAAKKFRRARSLLERRGA